MVRNTLIILLVFVLYEGFFLLPKKIVVLIPGTLRLSDIILLILPIYILLYFNKVLLIFKRFREESLLILFACLLVILSPLMAQLFFDQPYYKGLLLVRYNLCYLTFFMFVFLLRPKEEFIKLLNILTIFIIIYIFILVLTKYFPGLRLIHFREGYYQKDGFTRFGENRLFFPYPDLPILLYCLVLARILHPDGYGEKSFGKMVLMFGYIIIVLYSVTATFARMLVFSLLLTTVYALFASRKGKLKIFATLLIGAFICIEVLALAVSGSGISFIEESKLGKIALKSSKLKPETGRKLQASMYVEQFLKSPLTGVGTLAIEKFSYEEKNQIRAYQKYGFSNAIDLGYLKIAAEYGLLGIAWIAWFYSYLYRRSKEILARAPARDDGPLQEVVGRGLRYYLIYLSVSSIIHPHFVVRDGIPAIVLSLALMAVTRELVNNRIAPRYIK